MAMHASTPLGDPDDAVRGAVLSEVVSYIETELAANTNAVLKMTDISKLYIDRLANHGILSSSRAHTTRLKNRILQLSPNLVFEVNGRELFITCKENIADMMQQAYYNGDNEGLYLFKVANMCRREILASKCSFNGMFSENCQMDAVPRTLHALITMILYGTDIRDQDLFTKQQSLSIAQLILFNARNDSRKPTAVGNTCHKRDREPPLPVQ